MRVVALISGGKDSCYNMMQCVAEGHELVALANMRPNMKDEIDSYMFQSVGHDGVDLYAQAMDLPIFRRTIFGDAIVQEKDYIPDPMDEVEDLFQLLHNIKRHIDFEAVSVGAVLSDYQRIRVENVCSRLGLVAMAYLWRRDQEELLLEMIACQVKAIVIKVAALGLEPSKHLSKTIEEIYPHMVDMKLKYGLNVCGEGGEYETFTLDCPLFKKKIVVYESQTVLHSDNSVTPVAYLKLKNIGLEEKPWDPNQDMKDRLLRLPMKRGFTLMSELSNCGQMSQRVVSSITPQWTPVFKVKQPQFPAVVQPRVVCEDNQTGHLCVSGISASGNASTEDGIKDLVKTAMEKLKGALDKHGMEMAHIFLVHLYLKDMSKFKDINSVYCQYFSLNPPARVCVQVDLPSDTLLQIDCHAYKPLTSLTTSDHPSPSARTTMHVQSLSHWAPSNIGPYSQATQIGNVCFVAGQIGLCPASMELIEGGICAQSRLAARSAKRILAAMHPRLDLSSAMQVVCYLTDAKFIPIAKMEWQRQVELSEMMNGYNSNTDTSPGLMTYVVVPILPKNALVEWQVVAHTEKQWWQYSKHSIRDWSDHKIVCESCFSLQDSVGAMQLSLEIGNEDETIDLKETLDKLLDVVWKKGLPWKQMVMMRVFYRSDVLSHSDLHTALEDCLEHMDERVAAFSLVPVKELAGRAILTACCWWQE